MSDMRFRGVSPIALINDVPVLCNIQFATPEEARAQPRGTLDLHFCPDCRHFFNAAFDAGLVSYDRGYENSLHFSPTFTFFAAQLAKKLVGRLGGKRSQVVDVGCGQGDFLRLVCSLGDVEGHGFDPSFDATRSGYSDQANVAFHAIPFSTAKVAGLEPQLIICRHVLEHIAHPIVFLREIVCALRRASGPCLYLEVPNALYTVRDMGIWDLIYEHCQFYTPVSFARLAARSGVTAAVVYESFGGQYLSLDGGSHVERSPEEADERDEIEQLADAFDRRRTTLFAYWQSRLDELAEKGPLVVWGAGSKGVSFVNFLAAEDRVCAFVDVNPYKQGRYVAGTGHQIVGPRGFVDIDPAFILTMNPAYTREITELVRGLGSQAEIVPVLKE